MKIRLFLPLVFLSNACLSQIQWQQIHDSTFNKPVMTLFADSVADKLYIGGNFKYYGTTKHAGVAQWDGYQVSNLGCGLGGCTSLSCGGVLQFEKFHNELYAVFYEDSVGCQNIHHISKWTGSTWIDLGQNFYRHNSPTLLNSMNIIDSVLYIYGDIDSIMNLSVHGIVKYDGVNWDTEFHCSLFTDINLLLHPLIKYNGEIYAQNFLIDSTGNKQYFSVWRNGCWEKVPNAFSNNNHSIQTMCIYKNDLYIAGGFNPNLDSFAPGNSIAKWNGSSWENLNGGVTMINSNYTAGVYDMKVYNNELYIVGEFDFAGGLPAKNIAKWDGFRWCSLGSTFDREIWSITFYHDSLFVGGAFTTIDSLSCRYMAKTYIGNFVDSCQQSSGTFDFKDKRSFFFFPNPTNGFFIVDLGNYYSNYLEIIIRDLYGNVVKEYKSLSGSSRMNGNISEFPNGVYFLSIITEQHELSFKIIKSE